MANIKKIKISAPATNPHICYIDYKYKEDLARIKKETGLSAYKLLEICSGCDLSSKESILKAKTKLRKDGWHTIGEWAESLIVMLIDTYNQNNIINIDLSTIHLTRRNNK